MLLVKRSVFFIFALNFLSLFLYAIGTAQGFLDSNQIILLRVSSALGLLEGIAAFYGFIFSLFITLYRHKYNYLVGTLVYFFLAILGFFIAALISFILVALSGNAV
ncbi:hypothetical protein MASR2M78_15920 [Treponema sp.]